jgi:pimeloyl-ACP methyl ester carboxylesterase
MSLFFLHISAMFLVVLPLFWVHIVIGIAVLYLLLIVVFFFFQHFFFFRPEYLPKHFVYKYPFPFDEINFDMKDGGTVNGIHFKVPNAKGVVFYFKGNSRSIKGWGKFARDFVGKGYDLFMIDYRGFGKSEGRRTETILYNDSQHLYQWLKEKYAEENIVIYGRSLGSGIATRIASWNNPKMLILDSPYYSFLKQVQRYGFFMPIRLLLRYKIRTDLFIKKVKCPVFFIHGAKDRLIPFHNSVALQQLIPKQSMIFKIEKGGHNNLPSFSEYHDYLYDILNEENLLFRSSTTTTSS